jgi:preprotein translocase subunit SecF
MRLFKETKIDFLKYKIPAILASVVIILAGLALIAKNGLRYGVDFTGGTAIHVKFRNPVPLDNIRKILKDNGYHDSGVQGFNDPTQVLIRLPEKVSSADQVDKLSQRVTQLLSPSTPSEAGGKKDLNGTTDMELRQFILLKDPWGVGTAEKYQPEIDKLRALKQQNTGLYPQFDQMKGIDSKIVNSLKENYYISDLAILSTEYVGPQVGSQLRQQAKLAIIWSLLGLLVYTWFRFQFIWGVSAVVCLAHDVLVTLAFFGFFNREISLTVVAAFLTIVGFSLNDTIVIYDRVRDNLKSMRTQPLEQVINLSLNQMLSRTILTNGMVLAVVVVLYVFGGEVINDFAFAMLVGCVSGTYSTVYIASALIVFYEKYFGKKKKAQPVKAKVSQKVS